MRLATGLNSLALLDWRGYCGYQGGSAGGGRAVGGRATVVIGKSAPFRCVGGWKIDGIGEGSGGPWGSRLSALRPESVKANFVIVFRVPDGLATSKSRFRACSASRFGHPARGGGDTRWLAQNYTGRTIHTATEAGPAEIGFRQRVRPCSWRPVWLARNGFPDDGTTSISDWSRHSWCPFWRRARVRAGAVADGAVGAAVPGPPGGLPHPCLRLAGRMFRAQEDGCH